MRRRLKHYLWEEGYLLFMGIMLAIVGLFCAIGWALLRFGGRLGEAIVVIGLPVLAFILISFLLDRL